jgi:N-acetylmuramoyl-L-alanine amidase
MIKYLVVHCSDSPPEMDIGAKEIHQWHLERGFDGIGYHKVIKRNGNVEDGRPEYWVGSHVKGYNSVSLGVCLVGDKVFTEAQLDSLRLVLGTWVGKYPHAKVVSHHDLNSMKTCPNFNANRWFEMR